MSSRHAELARSYPTRALGGGGPAQAAWRTGDTYDPALLGWLLSIIAAPANDANLLGHLRLRLPMKDVVAHEAVNFGVARSGITFVPWPFVDLQVTESGGAAASPVTVAFWPVFRSDPLPSGVGSVLYGRTRLEDTVPDTFINFAVPQGATEYRVMPATATGALTISEQGTGPTLETYSRYVMAAAATAVPIGTETGIAAWRETPPGPGANIRVDGTVVNDIVTVFWRYDLGALR